jgi:secreted PhoX family phosphatase
MDSCFDESDDEAGLVSGTWEEQALQSGTHHDGMTFLPIDGNPRHGLLVIHHEGADDGGLHGDGMRDPPSLGVSVIEIFQRLGQWRVMPRSRYARRIDVQPAGDASRERSPTARVPIVGNWLAESRLFISQPI